MTTGREPNKRDPLEELTKAKNEDVEFSAALADEDDLEAVERAKAADERAAQRK
ncbi:YfhD family protein [Paenibacillus beijingensis]|uniref:YfhD family protein n=1 Tax=Paenibacillus beijingensis TaxID=1126833 RepID=UPI0009E3974B|nr:YfhD family protein [Paenibacillus beijingensis]